MRLFIATLIAASGLPVLHPAIGPAAVLRVPSEYGTVQEAVDAAAVGDSVLVAPGTYTNCDGGPCTPNVAVLRTGVSLVSESGPGVTALRVDVGGTSQRVVVRGEGILAEGATLRGFTITATAQGYRGASFVTCQGIRLENCHFEDLAGGVQDGAGLYANGSTLEVEDCEFRRCAALLEAGGFKSVGGTAVVIGCLFEECGRGGTVLSGIGGSSATVRDCVFRGNTENTPLAVLSMPQAEITRNVFDGNSISVNAAALVVTSSSGHASVEGNVFVGNVALSQTPVVSWSTAGEIRGNTFYGNTCPSDRAVVSMNGSWPTTLMNNIFAGNTGGPAFRAWVSPPQGGCNLFWANAGGDHMGYVPAPTDLFVDPRFCDPEDADLRLMSDSPCLPANSGACGLIGALGDGCGTVSVGPSSWARVKDFYR